MGGGTGTGRAAWIIGEVDKRIGGRSGWGDRPIYGEFSMVTIDGTQRPPEAEGADWLAAEYAVLTTPEGMQLLGAVEAAPVIGPAEIERWRAIYPMEQVAAAVRLVEARRRARVKLEEVDRLWLERVGVEQATASAVARHKAARFVGCGARQVWDLCCGLGFDTLALAEAGLVVVAVDRSQAACRRLAWNVRVCGLGERVVVVRGCAEAMGLRPGDWVHIDPDRRDGPSRSRQERADELAGYRPGLGFLRKLVRSGASGSIKLGPASDFEQAFGAEGVEIELVSLNGECKEATVWFGAARTCQRRATCLPAGATWSDRDGPGVAAQVVGRPLGWIFDPDPALIRSRLVDRYAAAHGLARLGLGLDWLTGEEPIVSGFVQTFEVIGEVPADRRRLRALLRSLGAGPLDVRTRGIRRSPDAIRRELRLEGDRPLTLFLHAGDGRKGGRAIVARRLEGPERVSVAVPETDSDNRTRR
ncbi:MAG: methyltransferase [Isosphaeraceae bacterium]|nr:MAG: methyltransferase [Isosphaeraceae bacterium]